MAAPTFLNLVAGRIKRVTAAVTSTVDALVAADASGKIDASFMPSGFGQNTTVATASEALAAGDLVNLWNSTGQKVRKADATVEGKEAHGFVLSAVANGAAATIYLAGNKLTGLTGLVPGDRQYLSATAGLRTATPPATTGNVVMMVGIAIDTTSMMFEPEEPVTLV